MSSPCLSATLSVPNELADPESLHKELLRLHQVNNAVQLRFILLLTYMHEGRSYLGLGYSNIAQYVEKHFGHGKSTTYEYLRVGKALGSLPRCREEYSGGKISYTQLREMTRVATAETEEEWLRFARERTVEELQLEARDAAGKARARPRKDGFGLPNLQVTLGIKCTLEEQEIVHRAFSIIHEEMRSGLGKEREITRDEVFMYLVRRVLEMDGTLGMNGARAMEGDTPYTIVYRSCPQCRRAQVETPNGAVSVPAETVLAVEGDAKRITIGLEEEETLAELPPGEIDPPSSASLARKVIGRDGARCSNPACGRRKHLHAHHIRFRSKGGRTALFNETTLCTICHALVHSGLLVVRGNRLTGLSWQTKADTIAPIALELQTAALRVPVVVAVAPPPSAEKKSAAQTLDDRKLWSGLTYLGWGKNDAKKRILATFDKLRAAGTDNPDEELVLRTALQSSW